MRRKLAFSAAISMAVGLAACTKIESRDLIREGNQLYKVAKYEEAISKYNQSLEIEPDGVTVLWNRAMAAESIVLALKDQTDEAKLAKREEYTTLALASLDKWNEKRSKSGPQDQAPECARPKPPDQADQADQAGETAEAGETADDEKDPDLEAYEQHRLALLGADARCDDLVEHWRQMHIACPQNEDLYMTIAQTFEDICGMPEKAEEWYVKRTEDFPESAKAWYSLATRRFYPLMPDPESGLPFNNGIAPDERLAIADEVIGYLEKATAINPQYRDPFVWRSMAYTQKSLARVFVEPPQTPQDAVQAILARRDSMLAWRETKAVCDIEEIPDCPIQVDETGVAPAVKTGVVFRDLATDGASWKDKEISIRGNVVNDSVKQVDEAGFVWEFDLEISYVPAPAVDPNADPDAEAVAPADGEAPAEASTKRVKINYTFLKPEVAEGEEAPDVSAEIAAQLDVWKRLKSTPFSGVISSSGAEGGDVTLVAVQKQLIGCCPPAPLTPEAEKSDADRLEQLRAELAALEAAAKAAAEKAEGKGK